jgi:RNAse (barnase) inhibitor barstar
MTFNHFKALLGSVAQAGVYHQPHGAADDLLRAAEANGFAPFRIDLKGVMDKDALLTAIAQAMHFPDWFGHNWDALADCLTDLDWHAASGYVILLEHCDGIHGHAENDFVTLLQVFSSSAEVWRQQDIPFWCFVDMQADGIGWLPTAG